MDDSLLERLLFQDESDHLDFKRDQYPFSNASDDEKSELLKDIVAMANSWRTGIGYILIGVDEVIGGRSNVVGVGDHLSDHSLQQFVDSKTKRTPRFSYRAYQFEGEEIGIIEVPEQERPVAINQDYGKLDEDDVWVRRGSASVKADSEEIARMARASVPGGSTPTLNLQFGDSEQHIGLGLSVRLETVRLRPRINPVSINPYARSPFGTPAGIRGDYYEKLITFVEELGATGAVGFVVGNEPGTVAEGVELRARIEREESLKLLDRRYEPEEPRKRVLATVPAVHSLGPRSVKVDEYPDHWEMQIEFGRIPPGRDRWTTGPLLVRAEESQEISFTAELYADNLPTPIETEMEIRCEISEREMKREDLEPFLDDG